MRVFLPFLLACASDPADRVEASDTPESVIDTTVYMGDTGIDAETADTAVPPSVDPAWDAFVEARVDHLHALAVPISACVVRQDTDHAVFDGCIDWHSAVHATWSLHVLSRLTGDPSYLEIANGELDQGELQGSLAKIEAVIPREVPYGYAWFLALAQEREQAGYTDLSGHADLALAVLEDDLFALDAEGIDMRLQEPDYDNLSWQVHNLWAFSRWRNDQPGVERFESFVREELLPRAGSCMLEREEANTSEFFPPCLHLARAIVSILEPAEWAALEPGLPDPYVLTPIGVPSRAHASGLNFSRTWGLWALWEATGDRQYRDLYREHIETHMAQPEYWADDYRSYSHWVAQFGVYGIALSF